MKKESIKFDDGSEIEVRVLSKKKAKKLTKELITYLVDTVEDLESEVERLKQDKEELEAEVQDLITRNVSLFQDLDSLDEDKEALVQAIIKYYHV